MRLVEYALVSKMTWLYQTYTYNTHTHTHTHTLPWHLLSVKAMSPTVFPASDYISLSRLKGENHFKGKRHTRRRNSHYVLIKHAQTAKMNTELLIHSFSSQLYFYYNNCGRDSVFDLSHCNAVVVKGFGSRNKKDK